MYQRAQEQDPVYQQVKELSQPRVVGNLKNGQRLHKPANFACIDEM